MLTESGVPLYLAGADAGRARPFSADDPLPVPARRPTSTGLLDSATVALSRLLAQWSLPKPESLTSRFELFAASGGNKVAPAELGADCAVAVVVVGGLRTRYQSSAQRNLVRLTLPGDLLQAETVRSVRGGAHLRAVRDTCVATLSTVNAEALLREEPRCGVQLMRAVAGQLARLQDDYVDLALLDVPARLAKLLLLLERAYGDAFHGVVRVEHGLSQLDMAAIVAASRETVNKSLRDFARRGWIEVDGKSFRVLDRDRLRVRAQQRA